MRWEEHVEKAFFPSVERILKIALRINQYEVKVSPQLPAPMIPSATVAIVSFSQVSEEESFKSGGGDIAEEMVDDVGVAKGQLKHKSSMNCRINHSGNHTPVAIPTHSSFRMIIVYFKG